MTTKNVTPRRQGAPRGNELNESYWLGTGPWSVMVRGSEDFLVERYCQGKIDDWFQTNSLYAAQHAVAVLNCLEAREYAPASEPSH